MLFSPFGNLRESVQSSRYRWDNLQRGDETFVIIQRTRSGCGAFRVDGRVHPVPVDHAFIAIVPEPSLYFYPRDGQEPWDFHWINLYGAAAISLMTAFRATYGPVLPLPGATPAGKLFMQLTDHATQHGLADPFEVSSTCYRFIMEWGRQLSRPLLQQGDPVENALALCALRFRERIGVKELAASTGLSREHFTRLFTQKTGLSPALHLRRLRTAAAREMLARPSVTLKETALRCGFPSARTLRKALAEEKPAV